MGMSGMVGIGDFRKEVNDKSLKNSCFNEHSSSFQPKSIDIFLFLHENTWYF